MSAKHERTVWLAVDGSGNVQLWERKPRRDGGGYCGGQRIFTDFCGSMFNEFFDSDFRPGSIQKVKVSLEVVE